MKALGPLCGLLLFHLYRVIALGICEAGIHVNVMIQTLLHCMLYSLGVARMLQIPSYDPIRECSDDNA